MYNILKIALLLGVTFGLPFHAKAESSLEKRIFEKWGPQLESCSKQVSDNNENVGNCIGKVAWGCIEEEPRRDDKGEYFEGIIEACWNAEYKAWDQRLNSEYGKIIQWIEKSGVEGVSIDHATAKSLQEKFRQAQRGWIKFRDTECKVRGDFSVILRSTGSMRDYYPDLACLGAETAARAISLENLYFYRDTNF